MEGRPSGVKNGVILLKPQRLTRTDSTRQKRPGKVSGLMILTRRIRLMRMVCVWCPDPRGSCRHRVPVSHLESTAQPYRFRSFLLVCTRSLFHTPYWLSAHTVM